MNTPNRLILTVIILTSVLISCEIADPKYDLTIINYSSTASFVLQDQPSKKVVGNERLHNGERYVFEGLDRGSYSVTATIVGYITAASISFSLDGNKTLTLRGGTLSIN